MATGKKRPVDEPAKDWEKTLEPVRKLAAIIRAVEKAPPTLLCLQAVAHGAIRHLWKVRKPAIFRR